MKNQFNNIAIIVSFSIIIFAIILIPERSSKKTDDAKQTPEREVLTLSQYQLTKNYGWKDIILWTEKKEDFERSHNTQLTWTNYVMGFKKDPNCTDPAGESGGWEYEKGCFNFVWPPNLPNILDEISYKTKGKTLVIIGAFHNNGKNFFGDVYWY